MSSKLILLDNKISFCSGHSVAGSPDFTHAQDNGQESRIGYALVYASFSILPIVSLVNPFPKGIADGLQALRGDLIGGILCGVPGEIVEIDQIDRRNPLLQKRKMVIQDGVFVFRDEVVSITQFCGDVPNFGVRPALEFFSDRFRSLSRHVEHTTATRFCSVGKVLRAQNQSQPGMLPWSSASKNTSQTLPESFWGRVRASSISTATPEAPSLAPGTGCWRSCGLGSLSATWRLS